MTSHRKVAEREQPIGLGTAISMEMRDEDFRVKEVAHSCQSSQCTTKPRLEAQKIKDGQNVAAPITSVEMARGHLAGKNQRHIDYLTCARTSDTLRGCRDGGNVLLHALYGPLLRYSGALHEEEDLRGLSEKSMDLPVRLVAFWGV